MAINRKVYVWELSRYGLTSTCSMRSESRGKAIVVLGMVVGQFVLSPELRAHKRVRPSAAGAMMGRRG